MKGPVRKAIDSGKYNLTLIWEKLDDADKAVLLYLTKSYLNQMHMGLLPFIKLGPIMKVLDQAARSEELTYYETHKRWPKTIDTCYAKLRTMIRLSVEYDLRLNDRLAKLRAKERRTA